MLDGAKSVVLHGDSADKLIVTRARLGRAARQNGIGLFLVDAKATGVALRGYPTVGRPARRRGHAEWRVGADAVLGEPATPCR